MNLQSVSKIAALAVAMPTTAFLLYWLFLRKDEDEDYVDRGRQVDTSRQTNIELSIPSKVVGTVIGHKGSNIRKIQEESGATVTFSTRDTNRDSNEDRTVFIRGDTESAQKAEVMIRQIVADMPTIVTEQVLVPVYCLGRLIGRGGETIRSLSRTSKCQIFIDRSQDKEGPEVPRVVAITGPTTHIELAKTLIGEKVTEEEEFRAKMALKGANREQRKPVKRTQEEGKERVMLPSRVVEPEEAWDAGDHKRTRVPEAEPVKEFMEVFVSAVEHAGHFWLQMVNTTALNLDKMTDDMSLFYSNPDIAQAYKLTEVKEGDIVAAAFAEDNMWYRARVEGFEEDKVDLYYFDFGDNGLVQLEALRELKAEYLSLPVQAIECKLANVKPAGGETWSEEACDLFEELTHCAEWKILSARTVGYVPVEWGQCPCVQLVDNNATPQPLDVAVEMVSRGFAEWDLPSSSPLSTATNDTTTTTTITTTNSTTTPEAASTIASSNHHTVRPDPVSDLHLS